MQKGKSSTSNNAWKVKKTKTALHIDQENQTRMENKKKLLKELGLTLGGFPLGMFGRIKNNLQKTPEGIPD